MPKPSVCLLVLFACPVPGSGALVVNSFAPTSYDSNAATMDATVGVTGYTIEDFEDTTLVAGLSYTLSNPSNGTFGALPSTFNTVSLMGSTGDFWDGPNALSNHRTNSPANTVADSGNRSQTLTFHIAGGANSFGVGLSSFQSVTPASPQYPFTNHELSINGVSYGQTESLFGWTSGLGRNVYLRIDATAGDLIHSVSFTNLL